MKRAQFFYRNENAPKPNRPNHIGAAILIEQNHKLLLEHRVDSERWAIIGGGLKVDESLMECVIRETFEETSIKLAQYMVELYKIYHHFTSFELAYMFQIQLFQGFGNSI